MVCRHKSSTIAYCCLQYNDSASIRSYVTFVDVSFRRLVLKELFFCYFYWNCLNRDLFLYVFVRFYILLNGELTIISLRFTSYEIYSSDMYLFSKMSSLLYRYNSYMRMTWFANFYTLEKCNKRWLKEYVIYETFFMKFGTSKTIE